MKTIAMIFFVASTATFFSFIMPQQQDPWKVPEKYEKMLNPVKSDEASVKAGRELYIEYCISCHGVKGQGNGKKAASLDTQPVDFTTASFQKHTDGAILYIIYFGHKDKIGRAHV